MVLETEKFKKILCRRNNRIYKLKLIQTTLLHQTILAVLINSTDIG